MVRYCVNKKRLFLLGASLFVIMIVSGIYSMTVEVISTKNTISTDNIDIELNEYDQNGNLFSEDGKVVMPGDKIKIATKVHNLGTDCYIRTKLIYKINNNTIAESDYINGHYKSWIKKDGYYYNKNALKQNDTVDLFDELEIPNDITDNSSITLSIIVEAIQADHFDNNWDGIVIKKSVDRAYNINIDGESSVIYENNSTDQIKLDDDFFDDLKDMVPGDSKSEVISISNNTNTKNNYYLSIDYDNLNSNELKLLSKMKMIIKRENGEVIVDKSLSEVKNKSLGIYKRGENEKITAILYLPKDADNDYSKLLSKIVFRFYSENLNNDSHNLATGDGIFDISIKIFVVSSIGFLIVLLIEKKNLEK